MCISLISSLLNKLPVMCLAIAPAARPNRTVLNQGQNWIMPAKRLAIYNRDGFACCYCGRGVEEEGVVLTLDHLEPYSKGGALVDATNLMTACRSCNSSRGDQPFTRFVWDNAAKWGREANCVLSYIRRHRAMPLDTKTSRQLIEARGTCRKVLDVVGSAEAPRTGRRVQLVTQGDPL